ncbi:hypothetical protein BT63DRAFT_444086 [Microthyrium microscopicum]|uniref:Ig-like domain-containing protein n=1 Tax=Microthyrium microscopicum TaxID=703497 RepID=A0A6A6TZQ3_9PEZI|nr:hypothetical protein BT63DRAFT_444086 [Microthyrium microscopicum]
MYTSLAWRLQVLFALYVQAIPSDSPEAISSTETIRTIEATSPTVPIEAIISTSLSISVETTASTTISSLAAPSNTTILYTNTPRPIQTSSALIEPKTKASKSSNPSKAPKPLNTSAPAASSPSTEFDEDEEETSGFLSFPYFLTTLVEPTNHTRTYGRGRALHLPPPPYQCQQYPGYFSSVNRHLDHTATVNLTCWTTAPAADKVSACVDHGNAWFLSNEGCYIADYIIETRVKAEGSLKRGGVEELTDILRYCPPPHQQVAAMRRRYRSGTYCYSGVTLESPAVSLGPANGSVELDCWVTGDVVRGDNVWWKWKSSDCYVPNQVFDPFSFFGNAHECHP